LILVSGKDEGSSTLEPPLRLKEMGTCAMAEVAAVVRCAYGRVWVDTGVVISASWSFTGDPEGENKNEGVGEDQKSLVREYAMERVRSPCGSL
jgi:hypothetical protein